jgi:dCTP diphosphatase
VNDFSLYTDDLFSFVAQRDWQSFETPQSLAMALGGEVGELLALLQWLTPEQTETRLLDKEFRRKLGFELADILNYLLRLARCTEVDLLRAAQEKLAVNERRYPVALARGNDAKYDALPTPADSADVGLGRADRPEEVRSA